MIKSNSLPDTSSLVTGLALSLFLLPNIASATTIFSQDFAPLLSSANGNSDFGSNNQKAARFNISSDATLGSISWLGIYHDNNISTSDTFTLRLFTESVSGTPDINPSVLNVNVTNTVNRTDTNIDFFGNNLFSYQANLGAGIDLATGTTYWLSIVNNVGTSNVNDWGWGASSTSGSQAAARALDTDSWDLSAATFQFELTAVPLPAAFWFMASGLFGLVSFRNKKLKVK